MPRCNNLTVAEFADVVPMPSSHRPKHRAMLVVILGLVACVGCSVGGGEKWRFAKFRPSIPFWKESKPDPVVPDRLIATWTDAVLHKQGQKPQRGFGGRIVFFDRASEEPVRVDGQLVVYAFDDTTRESYEDEPTMRFVFPSDEFALHESDSELGPSYSVWLPWDEVGGEQRKITLIARFEPVEGPLVITEPAAQLLPGTSGANSAPMLAEQAAPAGEGVRQASYTQSTDDAAERSIMQPPNTTATPALESVTIALPRGLGPAPAETRRDRARLLQTPQLPSVGTMFPSAPTQPTTPAGLSATTPGVQAIGMPLSPTNPHATAFTPTFPGTLATSLPSQPSAGFAPGTPPVPSGSYALPPHARTR